MGAKWQKHISKAGSSNKKSITLTVCKSLDDDKILPPEQRKNTKKKHKDCSQPLISPMVFVYRKMKNIEVMRRRLSVLLSRSLCRILRSLKKKKVYQTIINISLYGTFLKLNLRPMYLMFYQSTVPKEHETSVATFGSNCKC